MSDAAKDSPPPIVKTEQENNISIPSSDHITLRVKDQDQNEVFFRIKKSAPLKMLMDGYCVRKRVPLDTFVLMIDNRRLRPEQTPNEVGLEDGDEIDAFTHQVGGRAVAVWV
ncbi:hypothetical protein Ddye_028140 [Dipteronia dyeriana]|uniref:Small ubiquitin-related modifier n=1 Tax=Dipteronia dyeriana TaxID=168575 RepID=A0AAD9TRB8_9ROSI|nr:hypothetical protein Ddye_028140 [Dipteronia dyeriana]